MKQDIRWWQVLALVILLTGGVLSIWSAQQQDLSMRNELQVKTTIAKTGISTGYFEALNGSASDVSLPAYQALKNRLKEIRAADPDIRFVYVMGQRQDGSIVFYADSEPLESADYSPPGQEYEEASDVLRSVFTTGNMANEGPDTDRWGTWVSGMTPIIDPATGRVIAVLGMDVNANDWNYALADASAAIIAATLLIFVIIIGFGLIHERNLREKQRLETSEEKFFKAFHANPALVSISSIDDGRIIDVNESFLTALGYSRSEVIGKTTPELDLYVEPAERNYIVNEIKTTGQVHNIDVKIYRKNRDQLYGSLSSTTIDISGVSCLFTVVLDLTGRKQAEEALRESESRFRTIMHSMQFGIVIIDADTHTVLDANDKALEMIGAGSEQVIGSVCHRFICPAELGKCPVTDLLQTVDSSERVLLTIKGEKIPILKSVVGANLGGKNVLIESFVDITGRRRAEAALAESEARYRSIFELANDGIFLQDETGFIDCNPRGAAMYGLTREGIIGHHPGEFAPERQPDGRLSAEVAGEKVAAAMAGVPQTFEWRPLRADKSPFDVEITLSRLELGTKTCLQAIVRDITGRKQAEQQLRESEERYRFLVEHSHDIIYTLTPEGIFTFVSPAWTILLGHPVHEVIGHPFQPFVHPDDFPGCMEWLKKALETGKRQQGIEYRVRHIDGSWYWHTSSAVPLHDNSGTIIGFEGTARDITERKRADEALHQLTGRLSLATRAGGVGIWDWDVVNNTLTWDDQMFALYGISKAQFCGAYEAWQAGLHPDDKLRGDAEIQMALSGKKEFDTEFNVLWPDGTIHTLRALAVVQRDATGKPLRMIGTNWDITSQKVAEEVLRKVNKKLNILSSITRHDITNQLTVLTGYLRILEKKLPDTSFGEYFKKITISAQRISAMLKFTKEYEQIGVNAPVWQNCRILVDTAAKEAPLGNVIVKDELPACTEIYADPLVMRVFYNLMDNAARYGKKITTIRFFEQGSGDSHLIVCEDDGEGVPADEKEKIFERGFGKNTGLGLALSREILDITGITIHENGEPNKGARFEIMVPKGAWRLTCEDAKE